MFTNSEGGFLGVKSPNAMDPGDAPPATVNRRRVAPVPPPRRSSSLPLSRSKGVQGDDSTGRYSLPSMCSHRDLEHQVLHDEETDDDHTALTAQPSYDSASSYEPYEDEEQQIVEEMTPHPQPVLSRSPSSPLKSFHSLPTIEEAKSYATSLYHGKGQTRAQMDPPEQPSSPSAMDPAGCHDQKAPSKHILRTQILNYFVKGCFGVVLLIVVLVVFVVLLIRRKNGDETVNQSGFAGADKLEAVINFLDETRVTSRDVLLEPQSPQNMAIQWMVFQDSAQRPVPSDLLGSEALRYVQRYSLAVFYFATGGPTEWKEQLNFLSPSHECDWFENQLVDASIERHHTLGVSCNAEKMATQLLIPRNGLTGSLPPEVFELRQLSVLSLPYNALDQEFDGSMDLLMNSMRNLEHVDLRHNQFHGTVPPSLGNLVTLQVLALSNNNFHGPLPVSFSNLEKLKTLALDDNSLTGQLEAVTDHLTNLEYLYANRNKFVQLIDENFASGLHRLRELDLSENELYSSSSQSLPVHFFSHPTLRVLDMAYNDLRGTLPNQMTTNSNLQFLSVRGNELHGAVTSFSLPRMRSLTHLDIQENRFQGVLPVTMRNLKDLTYLAFGRNEFVFDNGSLPGWLWSLTGLRELSVSHLGLSGAIPTSLEQMVNLVALDLSGNKFSGGIPTVLWNLPYLSYLLLHDNSLNHDALPASTIMGVDGLQVVTLFGNQDLSGSLQVICEATDLSLLATDCVIDCPCCTSCCEKNGDDCFEDDLEAIFHYHEGSWGSGYTRSDFAFDPAFLD